MAALLGHNAFVDLHARSGGSCGGFGPLLGVFAMGPVVASLTEAMTMPVVLERGYTDVARTVLLSVVLMFFVGQRCMSVNLKSGFGIGVVNLSRCDLAVFHTVVGQSAVAC